jgi:hypothetical protein
MSTVSKEKMIKLNFSALKYEKSSDKAHSFSTGKYKGKYKGAIHLPKSISKDIFWVHVGGVKRLKAVTVPVWWWDNIEEMNYAKSMVEVIE